MFWLAFQESKAVFCCYENLLEAIMENLGQPLSLALLGNHQFRGNPPKLFGSLLEFFDIGASAEPFQNLAVRTAHGLAADQPPAIDAIGAAQTAFQRVGCLVLRRTLPGLPRALLVIGVERSVPAMAVAFLQRQPGVIHPFLIEINVPTIRPGGPDDLRHGLRQSAELLLALAQRLLGAFALGDVASGSKDADHLTGFVPVERGVIQHRNRAPVSVADFQWVIADRSRL